MLAANVLNQGRISALLVWAAIFPRYLMGTVSAQQRLMPSPRIQLSAEIAPRIAQNAFGPALTTVRAVSMAGVPMDHQGIASAPPVPMRPALLAQFSVRAATKHA